MSVMSLPILPIECFDNILFFLDNKSLYKCLFVNRYYCKATIPIIWRNPFIKQFSISISRSLIKTLLACLNEDEISSLIPCVIKFNIKPPLFEYVRFIKKLNHDCCVEHIEQFIKSLPELLSGNDYTNCREKLIHSIYNMIIQRSSFLEEFELNVAQKGYVDLPKPSIFTTYEPGFKNLSSLTIFSLDLISNDTKRKNTTKFLNIIPTFCNGIVNIELWIKFLNGIYVKQYMDIIKFQPLKRIFMYINNCEKISFNLGLEFRSETLKELILDSLDFKYIDLSFISKLKCLELLEFLYCKGFNHCEVQSESKLHLKEFKLWYCTTGTPMEEIISYLCNESLLKLALSYVTPKAAETVKEYCPNVSSLCIQICSDSVIPFICELRSLKVLNIGSDNGIDMSSLVKSLGNHLTSVEYLFFDFNIDLPSFIYFTNYCKANLKKWIITLDNNSLSKEYLLYVNNFQKVHNSLKEFGINKYRYNWTDEELEIVDMLKNQGINVVTSGELDLFH
ncbi:uncharacterized protein OCT59_026624 [Rhizophagus irregularis]|nr:hypothetical protein OCT59_026624 [Rhizophagus irregularis]GBC16600.2 hypothetical protein GLOIN_2v1784777 [Rhizophagus irregularis DAOM 181602=DAOM 197198]